MYSIIIPYRDRKNHIELLMPVLHERFAGKEYEVIVAEQDDNNKFRLSSLYNIGFQYSKGETIVFHDVDYVPSEDVKYELINNSPTYPVRRVLFLDEDNKPKRLKDIPDGYKHFYQDVGNHWGGVFMLSRAHMEAINGFNPLYIGWGKEEEETRLRLANKNLQCFRHEQGLFYALDHTDNCPPMDDPDFINNHKLLNEYNKDKPQVGFKELKAEVKTFNFSEEGWEKVTWLKIKNFEIC